jgi:hypothetical protein
MRAGDPGESGGGSADAARRARASLIDVTVPNAARVGDYLHGGRDNFEADRKAVRSLVASAPSVAEIPAAARAFRGRVVRYLAGEAGITQFLDIGAGMAPPGNTHEVAQAVHPAARIVYVESDPMVLTHAQALLRSTPSGAVGCVEGDITDTGAIIAQAGAVLDLGQPVAVLLMSALAHVASASAAAAVVSSLMAAVPSGSYLAVYHLASDLDPALGRALRHWNALAARPMTLRSRSEITALLPGLELVGPGVVPVGDWGRDETPAGQPVPVPVPVHGAVARKP